MKTICVHSRSFAAYFLLAALPQMVAAADTVQFTNRAPQVGQHGSREMEFTLDLMVSFHQAGQTISSERQSLSRDQQRQVTIVQVAGDVATKAEVFYSKAQETVGRGKQAGESHPQSVEGKSYVVERRGEELIVTDTAGNAVPEEERNQVAGSMEALGRPNPLGVYLHGKKMAVGQTLKMPNAMAADLLGMKEPGGEAQKVELKLTGIHQDHERQVADFDMLVSLKLPTGGAMDITGTLQLEPETCQIVAANFAGPVSMRDEEGPKGHTFEVHSDGTMKIAVRANTLR